MVVSMYWDSIICFFVLYPSVYTMIWNTNIKTFDIEALLKKIFYYRVTTHSKRKPLLAEVPLLYYDW